MRWAIVIENVLKMTKAPTNSAMAPNASSSFWTIATCLSLPLASPFTLAAPVATTPPAGTSGSSVRTSCSGETPSFPAAQISSSRPAFPNSACAVGTSKIASVSLPIESRPVNRATPVIVNSRTGPRVATPIRSPTARSCL